MPYYDPETWSPAQHIVMGVIRAHWQVLEEDAKTGQFRATITLATKITNALREAGLLVEPRDQNSASNELPHSRACGITPHPHGKSCADDCPTCHGTRATDAPSIDMEGGGHD